jgi:hypothetical protein
MKFLLFNLGHPGRGKYVLEAESRASTIPLEVSVRAILIYIPEAKTSRCPFGQESDDRGGTTVRLEVI